MLYGEYEPEVLKKLQSIERMMLNDFNALCKKYNIMYFAGGGTAIGAVRHQGMIPWDDDIDLNMLRDDYEKFLEVAEKEYGDKYYVLNARNYDGFPSTCTRWCLKGTSFVENCMAGINLPFGIFLDIFCFDPIPDDERLARKQWRRAWFWGKLMTLRDVSTPVLYVYGFKQRVLKIACRIGHIILKCLFSSKFLYKKAEMWARKSENRRDCSRVAYMFDTVPFLSVMDKAKIYPTKTVKFDDVTIEIAANNHEYLKKRFGDYMQLPPEDKRHNHRPDKLDFGKYDN